MESALSETLKRAKKRAEEVAQSGEYERFVAATRQKFPWRFERPQTARSIHRDYLRIVDHHLDHLLPQVQRYVTPGTRRVLDFGCGSGGSAIALCLVYPQVECYGTDIDAAEIEVACERAKLYGVADRCHFAHVRGGEVLPFADNFFDFTQCSSVIEYVIDEPARRFCIQEMVRVVVPDGSLFFSIPNRLYPFEIHSAKWGWNYFPGRLGAKIVDSTCWEIRRLARPAELKLYRTPLAQLLRPWTNFCLRRKPT